MNDSSRMVRYCVDGRLEISNNLVEGALRGVALGRLNWMFVGSMKGQGYRIWRSMERRNASLHSARLILPFIDPFSGWVRKMLSASHASGRDQQPGSHPHARSGRVAYVRRTDDPRQYHIAAVAAQMPGGISAL